MSNSRRDFIKKAGVTSAAFIAAPGAFSSVKSASENKLPDATEPFKLKYAPYFGMFEEHSGKGLVENIKFCNEMGFRAMFDNGLMDKSVADQEKISKEMQKLGMELGPFVLYADFSKTSFVLNDKDVRDMLVKRMQQGVEVAKRTGVKWALVVPGRFDEKLHKDIQIANIMDNMRYCCDVVEKSGLTIVLEPLNTLNDHPGLILTGVPQTYAICRGVNRPSCKMVNDLYHQQITEGNLIPNIEACWSEIAAFHVGDNPGRNEPTSGEINYKNVFKYLHSKKYQGVLCMEHGKSKEGKEGEARVIKAYRECDSFEA